MYKDNDFRKKPPAPSGNYRGIGSAGSGYPYFR